RILDFLDGLGVERTFVIGNSMGGAVASELAALAPDRVRRQAIMGSGGLSVSLFGPDPSEGIQRLLEFMGDPTRDRLVAWIKAMVYDTRLITDELVDERYRNAHAPGAIDRMRAIFGSMFDPRLQAAHTELWTKASSFTTQTLMLWGRDDRTLPYEQAHFAMRHVPNIELHVFPRCGHWVQVEQKASFERLTTEFFTRPE
ncbi:MAG: alpha/beta fold hydrolase, partial [Microbacterium sp.]